MTNDELARQLNERFAGLDEKFSGIDEKFAGIDKKFAGLDEKLAGLDGKVTGRIDALAAKMDQRFESVDQKMDAGFEASRIRDEDLRGLMTFGLEAREVLREEVHRRFDASDRKHDEQITLLKDVIRQAPTKQ